MSVNIRSLLDEVDKKLEQVLNHHIEQYIQQYVSSILSQLKLLEPITLNKDVIVNELIDLTMENSTKPKDKMQDMIHIKIEMTENKKDEKELCNVIEEPEPESFIRGLTGEKGPVYCSGLTGEKGPVAVKEQVEEEQVVEEQVEEEQEEQVEEEEEQVEEEEEEEDEQVEEEQVEEEQVVEEEEQSIETETKEEEEEEELFEIEIDDITYCTNNEESGFIWEVTDAGDIGNKVGYLKEGEPFFYKDENNKK